jgi:hypothetical protein
MVSNRTHSPAPPPVLIHKVPSIVLYYDRKVVFRKKVFDASINLSVHA